MGSPARRDSTSVKTNTKELQGLRGDLAGYFGVGGSANKAIGSRMGDKLMSLSK